MARTQIASDNFDSYTDASNLGDAANWLELNNSSGLLRVSKPASNGVVYEHFTQMSECRWDGSGTFSNDQYSGGALANFHVNGDTTKYIGYMVRASADVIPNRDYYAVRVYDGANAAATSTEVVKVKNDTVTVLYTKATGDSWTNADEAWIEAVDNGANVDLKIYKGSTLLRTVTDDGTSGGAVIASGKPGIVGRGGTDFCPGVTSFDGGDVTSDDTTIRPNSDVSITGWTSTGASVFSVIDETTASDADYATSPAITGTGQPAILGLSNGPLAAGSWAPRVRASVQTGTATLRISLLNSSNVSQGSVDITVTTTPTTYTPVITTSGSATRLQFEFIT